MNIFNAMLLNSLALKAVPVAFHEELHHYNTLLRERASAEQLARLGAHLETASDLQQQLLRAFAASEFIARACATHPALLLELIDSGELERSLVPEDYATALAEAAAACNTEQELDRTLRLFRRRAMVRIVWRDLNRLASLEETTAELSALAEACVQGALDFHYRELSARWGPPIGDDSGAPQPMVVLGMGKLGARELNVSSDIDLILAYPESGETENGPAGKSISNQEFFVRLGQKLIKSLDATTADGFVFRVDMRLRPYGQSGALALNYDALEEYYQTQGREWERYAMIKARVIATSRLPDRLEEPPDPEAGRELMALLRPFTYRKYIDYSAIESVRSMKTLINREVQRKGMSGDVKLGFGGIREVEFVVQAFQLIRGGRDSRLQERRVLKLLPLLEAEGYLPENTAQALAEAYRFLRDAEHALQGYQDRQTQALPVGERDRLRLAWVMGFDSWTAFSDELERHRQRVNSEFQAVIADPETERVSEETAEWQALWQQELSGEQARASLGENHCEDPERVLRLLDQLRHSRSLMVMQTTGRERLEQFMPLLLAGLAGQPAFAETLARILPLVEAVARRSTYLVLLVENPLALAHLIKLCAASPWIADQLQKYPALLDELLDARTLFSPPDKAALRDELRREMLPRAPDDLEGQMEALRYFRSAHSLRVAASEITDVLSLMKVSDYLTYIAEVILEQVLELAWQAMVARHGYPRRADGNHCEPGFVILGYGKLGGIELGHNSDLDLVFLHNADSSQYTDGEKPLDNQTFYTRLGQKIIHFLTTQTAGGQLYEVDMRLRPSGNSGLLVSSLRGFEKYQLEQAWTWEHQALVRARVVAGCGALATAFERVRGRVLCQRRNPERLRREVVDMRRKMREHLGTKGDAERKAAQFHLKHDSGGIVDIEFMVQYAVLAWAHQEPALARYSDNIRILSCLEEAGLLGTQEVAQLIDAYKAYRSMGHRLALQRQPSVLDGGQFVAERQIVQRIWQRLLGEQAPISLQ